MITRRFFLERPIQSDHVTLGPPEAQHLARVLRLKPGDRVVLFDGTGREFDAQIESTSGDAISLRVEGVRDSDRELQETLEIGVALPKGERQKVLVEKLVELGVTTLIPLSTGRGVAGCSEHNLTRLRRVVIEASKQCGRSRLMRIEPPQDIRSVMRRDGVPPRWIADPSGSRIKLTACKLPATVLIGPEGGWTENELELATDCGWQTVALGPRVLRVETAAVAVAALFSLAEPI